MQRFKNIMYVDNGSGTESEALHRAIALASNNNARLKVVEVIEEVPEEILSLVRPKKFPNLKELISRIYMENLDRVVSAAGNQELQISTKLLIGKTFIELIREVLRENHDLVIMNAATGGGLKEYFFGTDTMHMIRKCPCPVWVIKQKQRSRFSKILAAIDPSISNDESDKVKAGLNKKIMELSTSLAQREGSELHIIHAWELYLETTLRNQSGLSKSEIDELINETRRNHETKVHELIKEYSSGLSNKQIHILKGRARYLIPEVAEKLGIELIVMGTVSRIGVAGLIIGNTAEETLDRVDCSVLAVKPDGFVTPVKLQ